MCSSQILSLPHQSIMRYSIQYSISCKPECEHHRDGKARRFSSLYGLNTLGKETIRGDVGMGNATSWGPATLPKRDTVGDPWVTIQAVTRAFRTTMVHYTNSARLWSLQMHSAEESEALRSVLCISTCMRS